MQIKTAVTAQAITGKRFLFPDLYTFLSLFLAEKWLESGIQLTGKGEFCGTYVGRLKVCFNECGKAGGVRKVARDVGVGEFLVGSVQLLALLLGLHS